MAKLTVPHVAHFKAGPGYRNDTPELNLANPALAGKLGTGLLAAWRQYLL